MAHILSGSNPRWVITTRYLENYGSTETENAHASAWKAKTGNNYIVEGLSRDNDAMALVQLKFAIGPNPKAIEVVQKATPYDWWEDWLNELGYQPEADFYRDTAIHIHVDENGQAHNPTPIGRVYPEDH